jgi:4-oxalocrotonate tautomerase
MPYLKMRVSAKNTEETTQKIVDILMDHTTNILQKKADVTSIDIEYVSSKQWFVGGKNMDEQNGVTFYLDVKVTDGTNSKVQKSQYINEIFNDMDTLIGPIKPASYIVIDDIKSDSWGFQGSTQEFRFAQNKG